MQLGMIGLGRMGGNMASRLKECGHSIVGFDMNPQSVRDVDSLEALVGALSTPRAIWVMLPAGGPTDSTIKALAALLDKGDVIIDGGNTHYSDDIRHAKELEPFGIHFMDVGVSGGVWGKERGYALMIGGSEEDYQHCLPIYESLKPKGEDGLVLAGGVGAGHFAKMVHNGIEYAMMQGLGEGYATMTHSGLIENPGAVVASWRHGTVIESWLLDLLARALEKDPDLEAMPPVADESGEARWMAQIALELGVPVPATAAALFARQTSRGGSDDALKVVSALRAQFGGHVTKD
ncbi:phosphogluconate dehydrogenase (NAD(+)-dependent, decarboxylating) [Bifidobacterium aquikefiri]|uniref:phosphogluconate dehydrogenase (NAD(+)-dependent, decarboxylating) n=1 Tax=Bifidobacterium aquikefiri TaxID=1653207 RepID=UPI0039EB5872